MQITSLRQQLGFSILFITHDLSLLVEISTHISIMYAGDIVEKAPARELFEHPGHPYTLGLINSFPSISGEKLRLSGIPGSPPNLISPPSGCKFHPRCPVALPVCNEVVPLTRQVSSEHTLACHLFSQ